MGWGAGRNLLSKCASGKEGISEGSDRNYTIPRGARNHTSNMEESASKYEEILTSIY